MKSWMKIAGCSVAMVLMLTACGGQQAADTAKKPATTPAAEKPNSPTPDKPAAAAFMAPRAAVTNKRVPFSPEMSAEFMRKVMETSARIEGIKKQIAERQAVIFETNPEVKAYRAQLIKMQSEINKILAADAELNTLKLNRDMLWTTMPTLPRGKPHGGLTRGFIPIK